MQPHYSNIKNENSCDLQSFPGDALRNRDPGGTQSPPPWVGTELVLPGMSSCLHGPCTSGKSYRSESNDVRKTKEHYTKPSYH